jgi:hypothetical protein
MNFRNKTCIPKTHENMFTTPVQRVALIAASTAFPPCRNVSTPIFEHSSFSAATAPLCARMRYAGFLAPSWTFGKMSRYQRCTSQGEGNHQQVSVTNPRMIMLPITRTFWSWKVPEFAFNIRTGKPMDREVGLS